MAELDQTLVINLSFINLIYKFISLNFNIVFFQISSLMYIEHSLKLKSSWIYIKNYRLNYNLKPKVRKFKSKLDIILYFLLMCFYSINYILLIAFSMHRLQYAVSTTHPTVYAHIFAIRFLSSKAFYIS